jgi:hypothetical protein
MKRGEPVAHTDDPPKSILGMPLLFSYGTLQQENVQLSTFGRLLQVTCPAFFGPAES